MGSKLLTLFFPLPSASYELAINFQEKVVEGLEAHGPSVKKELDEAVRVLDELKKKSTNEVAEVLMEMFSEKEDDGGDDESLSSGNSPPPLGISEIKDFAIE